ncbi:MAG: glycosyl hydrolase family 95 catalytic domain-containing protein [Bryobacteraceae bacterium]
MALNTEAKNHARGRETAATDTDAELRARISRADLLYDQPVTRSEEGMPLGNGRMGTLVWTTPTQIRLQINRVDVYANNSYSNSFNQRHNDYCGGCAYVDIDFGTAEGETFVPPSFRQRLSVYDGAMTLTGRQAAIEMIAWPEMDVIAAQIGAGSAKGGPIQVKLRMLRHASQYFGGELETFTREHAVAVETRSHLAKCQLLVMADRIVLTQEFREDNYFNKSAVAIAFEGWTAKADIADKTEVRLIADRESRPATVLIASTSSFDPANDVLASALDQIEAARGKGYAGLKTETSDWWHRFWERGSVRLESTDGTAEFIEANYHYFLYVMGASSRGKFPPKFNGMLWNTGGDLRTWGAQHWFANTSCYYEALFATNRLELLDPFFDMYSGMYESCAVAAEQQWGSPGMYIPETAYFDGLEKLPEDVAQEMRELYLMRKPWAERSERFRLYSETKHPHSSRWNWIASGKWVKGRWVITERGSGPYGNVSHIFGTTAKIAYLFWRRFEFTQDRDWLRARAYPMLRGAAEFYRNHPNVQKEEDGKYHIRYANSNESVWGARDTDEDLSAMRGLFAALVRAAELLNMDPGMQPVWRAFLQDLAQIPTARDQDALRPPDYAGPNVFARGRRPAVKAGSGVLPDQNSLPQWFFDQCNPGTQDGERLRLANDTFASYFPKGIEPQTPVGVLSKLAIAAATLGRADAVRHLLPNQIRTIRPERNTAYRNGGVLLNRMTLREGPQALDVQRLGRAAEALHVALLQSAPPEPGTDPVIRLFAAWPKDWNARFQLLARGGFLVHSETKNGAVINVRIRSGAGVECRIANPWPGSRVTLLRDGNKAEALDGEILDFPSKRNEVIELVRL